MHYCRKLCLISTQNTIYSALYDTFFVTNLYVKMLRDVSQIFELLTLKYK